MNKVGLIRCEKNENRCPLAGCLQSLKKGVQGFEAYQQPQLVGVFTCRCPGEDLVEKANILKSKGAQAIHFCTCAFAHQENGEWFQGEGLCDRIDELCSLVARQAKVMCVKGTAHLPKGYITEIF